jgi:hypothetical protein
MSNKKLVLISLFGISSVALVVSCFSFITNNQHKTKTDANLVTSSPPQTIPSPSTTLNEHHSNDKKTTLNQDSSKAYEMALSKAEGASLNAESSKSVEDWQFIISLWEDAIETLKQVPPGDKNYSKSQQKITEFKKRLELAKSKVKSSPTNSSINDSVKISRNSQESSNPGVFQQENLIGADIFLTDYLNYITTKGGTGSGTGYFCKETENLASSLFSPTDYKILDVSEHGENASASVRISSSNKGGSPIVADWNFYIKKGEAIIDHQKGGWCIALLDNK